MFKGQILKDGDSLESLNVSNGCTMHMVIYDS